MKPNRSMYLWPLIVAALVRLGSIFFVRLQHPMLWEYGVIARNLLHGLGYSFAQDGVQVVPSAFMPPGQVYVQYIGLLLFGDGPSGYFFIFLEQVLFGVLFVYFTGKIARLLFQDRTLERLALWLAALYPSFVFATTTFGVTSAVLFLDSVLIYFILLLFERMRREPLHPLTPSSFRGRGDILIPVGLGLVAGCLTFFRSESVALVPLILIILTFRNWKHAQRPIQAITLAGLIMVIVVAPWVVRNYMMTDHFVFGSTNGGFNFWRGHNPDASGSSWMANGAAVWTTPEMWKTIHELPSTDKNIEFVESDYHQKMALQWIEQHPGQEALLDLKKVALFWGIDWYSSIARKWPYILLYGLTISVSLWGFVAAFRERQILGRVFQNYQSLIISWSLFYTALVIVFFSLPRFQVLMIGVYLPYTAYGALEASRFFSRNRAKAEGEVNKNMYIHPIEGRADHRAQTIPADT